MKLLKATLISLSIVTLIACTEDKTSAPITTDEIADGTMTQEQIDAEMATIPDDVIAEAIANEIPLEEELPEYPKPLTEEQQWSMTPEEREAFDDQFRAQHMKASAARARVQEAASKETAERKAALAAERKAKAERDQKYYNDEEFDFQLKQEVVNEYVTNRKLLITSLNDQPVTITGVKVNRGNCRLRLYDTVNMHYSSQATGYLFCDLNNVREVEIRTQRGVYTARF